MEATQQSICKRGEADIFKLLVSYILLQCMEAAFIPPQSHS